MSRANITVEEFLRQQDGGKPSVDEYLRQQDASNDPIDVDTFLTSQDSDTVDGYIAKQDVDDKIGGLTLTEPKLAVNREPIGEIPRQESDNTNRLTEIPTESTDLLSAGKQFSSWLKLGALGVNEGIRSELVRNGTNSLLKLASSVGLISDEDLQRHQELEQIGSTLMTNQLGGDTQGAQAVGSVIGKTINPINHLIFQTVGAFMGSLGLGLSGTVRGATTDKAVKTVELFLRGNGLAPETARQVAGRTVNGILLASEGGIAGGVSGAVDEDISTIEGAVGGGVFNFLLGTLFRVRTPEEVKLFRDRYGSAIKGATDDQLSQAEQALKRSNSSEVKDEARFLLTEELKSRGSRPQTTTNPSTGPQGQSLIPPSRQLTVQSVEPGLGPVSGVGTRGPIAGPSGQSAASVSPTPTIVPPTLERPITPPSGSEPTSTPSPTPKSQRPAFKLARSEHRKLSNKAYSLEQKLEGAKYPKAIQSELDRINSDINKIEQRYPQLSKKELFKQADRRKNLEEFRAAEFLISKEKLKGASLTPDETTLARKEYKSERFGRQAQQLRESQARLQVIRSLARQENAPKEGLQREAARLIRENLKPVPEIDSITGKATGKLFKGGNVPTKLISSVLRAKTLKGLRLAINDTIDTFRRMENDGYWRRLNRQLKINRPMLKRRGGFSIRRAQESSRELLRDHFNDLPGVVFNKFGRTGISKSELRKALKIPTGATPEDIQRINDRLRSAVEFLKFYSARESQVQTQRGQLELQRHQEKLQTSIDEVKTVKPKTLMGSDEITRTGIEGLRKLKMVVDLPTYADFVEQVSGSDSSTLYEELVRSVDSGITEQYRWSQRFFELVDQSSNKHFGFPADSLRFRQLLNSPAKFNVGGRKPLSMTNGEVLDLVLTMSDPESLDILNKGGFKRQRQSDVLDSKQAGDILRQVQQASQHNEFLQKLINFGLDVVGFIRDKRPGMLPSRVQETMRNTEGYELEFNDHYYPREVYKPGTSKGLTEPAKKVKSRAERYGLSTGLGVEVLQNVSPIQPRTGSRNPLVIKDFMQRMTQTVHDLSKFSELAQPLGRAESIVYNEDFKNTFVSRYGSDAYKLIKDALRESAFPDRHFDKLDLTSRGLMRLRALKLIGLSSNALLQASDSLLGISEGSIPSTYFKQSISQLDFLKPEVQELARYSPLYHRRYRGESYEGNHIAGLEREIARDYGITTGRLFALEGWLKDQNIKSVAGAVSALRNIRLSNVRDKAFVLHKTLDKWSFLNTLGAANRYVSQQFPQLKGEDKINASVKLAEQVMNRTQGTDNPLYANWIELISRESPKAALPLQFMKTVTKSYSVFRRHAINVKRNPDDPKAWRGLLKYLFYGAFAMAAFDTAITTGRKRMRQGHFGGWEQFSKDVKNGFVDSLTQRHYFIGPLYNYIKSREEGSTVFAEKRTGSPFYEPIRDIYELFSASRDYLGSDPQELVTEGPDKGKPKLDSDFNKVIEKAFGVLGYALPVWQPYLDIRGIYRMTDTQRRQLYDAYEERSILNERYQQWKNDDTGRVKEPSRKEQNRLGDLDGFIQHSSAIAEELSRGDITKEQYEKSFQKELDAVQRR